MDYVIEMLNISKSFPGIKANDNITLQLKKGEILALLGENGAGKSTLMSILFGLYQPDEGEIRLNGKRVEIKSPNDATAYGIGMVHQHFKLVDCFTVLDNIILGVEDTKAGFLDKKKAREKIVELSKKYDLYINPDLKIEDITVGMQQRTEILKMLYRDNDILIFDEPTAVLTPLEIKELMIVMKNLAKEGKSILFITHKLDEIMEVSDRCLVLRKGKLVNTVETKNTDAKELSNMMVGRPVQFSVDKKEANVGETILELNNVNVKGRSNKRNAVTDVSFKVNRGEIVAIAGIDGNGQTELVSAITGLSPMMSGSIKYKNKDITSFSIDKKNREGITHIPEDRHKHGLVLDYELSKNMVLKSYNDKEFSKNGFIDFEAVRKYSDKLCDAFDVRSGQGSDTIVRSMSGGNQQKAIVAREMSLLHDLLIAVQPTRGLDVGAIEFIHKEIVKERDSGKAILLFSLELDEVLNLADRILVMHNGEIVGEFRGGTIDAEELGLYMIGAKNQYKNIDGEEAKNA